MTSLQPFEFEGAEVRVVEVDGEAWFVAADVARLLEYRMASDMGRSLEPDEKGTHLVRTPGGEQELNVVSEPGLFKLIVQRQTGRMTDELMAQKIKRFQRWLTHDVLPSIRKTGGYQVEQKTDDQVIAQALGILQSRNAELEAVNSEQALQLQQQESVVEYHEKFVAEDDDLITIDDFASQFHSTGPTVRDLLHSKKIAVRRFLGKRWSESSQKMVPVYQWRAAQGKTTSKWFDSRPQHNAPRMHNGQVAQTLYVKQYYAEKLAERIGIIEGFQPHLEVVS